MRNVWKRLTQIWFYHLFCSHVLVSLEDERIIHCSIKMKFTFSCQHTPSVIWRCATLFTLHLWQCNFSSCQRWNIFVTEYLNDVFISFLCTKTCTYFVRSRDSTWKFTRSVNAVSNVREDASLFPREFSHDEFSRWKVFVSVIIFAYFHGGIFCNLY